MSISSSLSESKDKKVLKSTCRMCHGGCGILVHVKDGRVVKIEGDAESPINWGVLCGKGLAAIQELYHPDRLKYPLKRVGERGECRWQRISWDEALNITAERLKQIKEKNGAEAVVWGTGTATNSVLTAMRLANLFGTPNIITIGYFCQIPRINAAYMTGGGWPEWDSYPFPDYDNNPKCIIAWGSATPITNHHGNMGCKAIEAYARGAKIIVVDPRFSRWASKADIWLQIRPCTDAALALGMMNVIINEKLYDKEFVEKWTVGFDRLTEHVKNYSPQKVAEITWVPANKIEAAARMYAKSKPACIDWGTQIEHNINATQTCRAIFILMGITGNVDVPGGNVFWLPVPIRDVTLREKLPPEQVKKKVGGDRFPASNLPVWNYAHAPSVFDAMLTGKPYPIKAMLVFGNNTLKAYANSKKIKEALMKLEFLVVIDMFMTPTAELADIVLPASHWLERDDFVREPGPFVAGGQTILPSWRKAVEPLGESWDDFKIVSELGRRMGYGEFFPDFEEFADDILKPAGVTFKELQEKTWITYPIRYRKYEENGFPSTPSRKFEIYSSIMEGWGHEPLPSHHEPHESPIATPEIIKEYPLIMITGARIPLFWHSQGRQIPWLREIVPEPQVDIHPKTAARLGINNGDWIYVETRKGRIKHKAKVTLGIDPRVVHVQHGWWYPEKPGPDHGMWEASVNLLYDDSPADPVGGATPTTGAMCRIYKAEEV